jgi:hypothetical protein
MIRRFVLGFLDSRINSSPAPPAKPPAPPAPPAKSEDNTALYVVAGVATVAVVGGAAVFMMSNPA